MATLTLMEFMFLIFKGSLKETHETYI